MLHAIVDYARVNNIVVPPGFKPRTIHWLIVFSAGGEFLHVFDTTGGDKRSKGRTFGMCPDLTPPEMVSAGTGCRHFLVDDLGVVALLTKDGSVDEKLTAKHEYFVNLLRRAAEVVPVLGKLASQLTTDEALAAIRRQLAEKKAKPTELATFAIADGENITVLVEQPDWHNWWCAFRDDLAEQRKAKASGGNRDNQSRAVVERPGMRCLLSGELVEPLLTSNKIEGLSDVGGLSMGDALASFDKDAFCSYGLEQGANAAMSERIVKTYATALNDLIKHHSHRLAGVKVVYWYSESAVEEQEDVLAEVLGGFDFGDAENLEGTDNAPSSERSRRQAETRARRLLNAIRTGERPDLEKCRYHALSLSANSGRVVIRDWMEGPFQELAEAVDQWFEDLSIIARDGQSILRSHKFGAVLAAPLRDLKDAPAPLVTAMWRCAVKRQPIPRQIMAQTLSRVRIDFIQDEPVRHARLGLLKAYCIRHERMIDMTADLNEHESHHAYLCGRILAVLARIQNTAMPGVGAGVVQRYYAAASATPALVLGRLVRNAQIAHLPKIEQEGLRRWFENQLADIWVQLKQAPARVLTLEEQTLFAMGYYHQLTARRSTGAENDNQAE